MTGKLHLEPTRKASQITSNPTTGRFFSAHIHTSEFIMKSNAAIKKYLKNIIRQQPVSLEAEVAKEALENHDDDIISFFKDLLQYGCQSGMICSLIYYCDTHSFYDKYYNEIENLRYDIEESFGEPLHPKGDLKNWYAWLAFEETARKIAEELEFAF